MSLRYNDPNHDPLSSPSTRHYLQCPLHRAPRCFRAVLVRSLELGEGNFIPTNWKGFCDYFGLQELKAGGAGELVDAWTDRHPYRAEHTLLKVVEYAQSTKHAKLLQSLGKAMQQHLLPEHGWTEDPADCFQHCHICVPLKRTNSKSFEDVRASHDDGHQTHRRTHSLPKNIEIGPRPCACHTHGTSHTPCTHSLGGSRVTNIFMSCNCAHSPFSPQQQAFSPSTTVFPTRPHTPTTFPSTTSYTDVTSNSASLTSPTTTSGVTSQYTSTPLGSPVYSIATPTRTSQEWPQLLSAESLRVPPPVSEGETRESESECHGLVGARRRLVSDSFSSPRHHPTEPGGKRKTLCQQRHSSSSTDVFNTWRSDSKQQRRGSISDSQLCCCEQKCSTLVSASLNNNGPPLIEGSEENGSNHRSQNEVLTGEKDGESDCSNQGEVDIMQQFGLQLFDTAPYNMVRRLYNRRSREAIILLLASFFLYNGFRCILQTMCEDGGFLRVFTDRDAMPDESTRKVVMLYLRLLTVVICPLFHCLHISTIARTPYIPKTNFSQEEAIERMMKVHRHFSPHYELSFIQTQPRSIFAMSGTMNKRHINSIWMSVLNSLLFPALLAYIGVVRLGVRGFTESGVCQFISLSAVHVPLLNSEVHLLMVLDALLSLGVLMCINTLKDYYYYENRIAVFAVTVGGDAELLYREIRRRWFLLDLYCYLTAVAIIVCSLTLASVQRTIIPDPPSMSLRPELLLNWCFWISVVSVVLVLSLSSNRLVKKSSLLAYLLVAVLLNLVDLNIDDIPPETLEVFFLVSSSALVLCLLFSLCRCHYHHYCRSGGGGGGKESLSLLLLTLSLIAALPAAVILTLYRELAHLAGFVQW